MKNKLFFLFSLCFGLFFTAVSVSADISSNTEKAPPEIPPGAKLIPQVSKLFRPDPSYDNKPYNAEGQVAIYGGKHTNPTARPLLELGRELYTSGPFQPGYNVIGKKNLAFPHAMAYGDYRVAAAYNDNGKKELWTLANRLNLDIDAKITSTERIHAFMRPLDKNGTFTRYDFGPDRKGNEDDLDVQLDGNVDALFFEGDMGPILTGLTNRENELDVPFALGLMPMLLQNGVWMEDAFTGAAVTVPARNSKFLDISNMDLTFFVGVDRVTSRAVVKDNKELSDNNAKIYGAAAFVEALQGYFEMGYGYTDTRDENLQSAPLDDLGYNNATLAFTRRYFHTLSNSMRVIWNFGQDRDPGLTQTADGWLFLLENSLITPKPLTLVPYVNLFLGRDKPQSLARDAGAGGVLKNTGIVFETDGLTGFPKLDDTGADVTGGAAGLEYLFALDQQVVFEAGAVKDLSSGNAIKGDQMGLGIRYQLPLTNALIFRTDLIYAELEGGDENDLFGVRFELRRKF